MFVQLLPEIAEAQGTIERHVEGPLAALDRHAYLLALIGPAIFYGLERVTLTSRAKRAGRGRASATREDFRLREHHKELAWVPTARAISSRRSA